MSQTPPPNLPAVIEGPESIRRANALFDLQTIRNQASATRELDTYATAAATKVIASHLTVEIPQDYKAISELYTHFHPNEDDKAPKLTHSAVINMLIGPDATAQLGVSDRNIAVDAAAALHPDKQPGQGVRVTADEGDTLKALTNAQALGKQHTAQALYAETVATGATRTDESGPVKKVTELELARYKAHVALKKANGKFASKDEVDQWKQQQIERLPAKVRAAGLNQVVFVLGQLLGADAEGRVIINGIFAQEVISGFDTTYRRIEELRDESRSSGLETDFDRRMFDRGFSKVMSELESVLRNRRGTYVSSGETLPVIRALIETCKKPIDESSIALQGLYKILEYNTKKNDIIRY